MAILAGSRKSSLTKVIFRLDFQKEISFSKEFIDELGSSIKDSYPELKTDERVLFSLTIESSGKTTKEKRDKIYRLTNKDTGNTIVLEPDSLAVDLSTYSRFSDLQSLVGELIRKVGPQIGEMKLRRIGLRYINEIKMPEGHPLDWTEFINENLVSNLRFVEKRNDLSRAMTVLEFAGEEFRMRFQYGLFNSEYPNPIAKREFVLDYDCYLQEEFLLSDVSNYVSRFHAEIMKTLRESVSDGLLGMIEG